MKSKGNTQSNIKGMSINFLKGISRPDKLFTNKKLLEFNKNDFIFHEGSINKGIFLVSSGIIKICKKVGDRQKFITKLAKKGDIIGIPSIIGKQPYQATAQALTLTKGYFLSEKTFLKLINNNPYLCKEIMILICKELRFAKMRIISLSQKNAKQRLAEIILWLSETFGVDANHALKVNLLPKDLSGFVGTAVGNLYKLLVLFNDAGYIEYKHKHIKILKFKKLSEISNSEGVKG